MRFLCMAAPDYEIFREGETGRGSARRERGEWNGCAAIQPGNPNTSMIRLEGAASKAPSLTPACSSPPPRRHGS